MQEVDKNKIIIEKMIKYCDEICKIKKERELTKEKYLNDRVVQLALDMCIFQLTELSKHAGENFKHNHIEIPWAELSGMRNIHGHEYDKVDRNIIWDTISNDIDILKDKLMRIKF